MQAITPFLWFDSQAEEAAKYYVSVFDDSAITGISRYPENTPGPAGSVMTVSFVLKGQEFTALNGGPEFDFTRPSRSTFTARIRTRSTDTGTGSGRGAIA